MPDTDITILSILTRFVSIIASIVIGGVMVNQTYRNALCRREALIQSFEKNLPKSLIRHCLALFANLLFVWLLIVVIVVLCAKLMGFGGATIYSNPVFLSVAFIVGVIPVACLLLGKHVVTDFLRMIRS